MQAPRGEILDRHGQVLVDNRTALELQVKPTELPAEQGPPRAACSSASARSPTCARSRSATRSARRRSSARPARRRCAATSPTTPSTTCARTRSASPGSRSSASTCATTRRGRSPPTCSATPARSTTKDLEDPRYEALEPGDQIGQQGVEYTYDSLLRGINGSSRVQVDASGQPTGGRLSEREPQTGNDLVLSLDDAVQRAGEQALGRRGLPGGFVAMNIDNGQLYGLGSAPPTTPPCSPSRASLRRSRRGSSAPTPPTRSARPRRSSTARSKGLYPTGSTFKPITALAALDSGAITQSEIINDGGVVRARRRQRAPQRRRRRLRVDQPPARR